MIKDFLARASELDTLKRKFPSAVIRLTSLGFYAPELDAAQWELHYGAEVACGSVSGETPERSP